MLENLISKRKMISIILCLLSLMTLMPNNAFAEEITFNLVQGFNGISLPFENTEINNAELLCQVIDYCESISYWDAPTQKFVTHKKGSAENNFSLTPGYPYFVSVTQDISWIVSGDIPPYLTFELITTDTTDVNTIALPLDRRLYITDAEKLAQDIPYCDTVWYWDVVGQGFVGHPKGSEINNFPVYPGYPYFVNITEDTTWLEDNISPTLNITYPIDGAYINTTTPNITITFSDDDSGINTNSFSAQINGVDSSSFFTVTQTGATYQVTTDLPVGGNIITASISDKAGNTSSATSNFTIGILRAIPGANPTSGIAPLTVHFTTSGEDPGGTIQVFRWDFDGNGTWDTYDSVARDYDHTYNTAGTYNATLFVQSSTGMTATASITITVQSPPPVAAADVVPSNGQVPLNVQLFGTGTSTGGSIVLYEWDFDGDGTFDWSSTTTGNTTHTYEAVGTYQAIFRVTDNMGQKATASAYTTVVNTGPPGSPTATASASPTEGDAPLTVNFSGSGTDPNGNIVLYEWDLDGDGTYEWSSTTSGNTTYTYTQAGLHVARFRVTDSEGLTGVDQVGIYVHMTVSLSIPTNTVGTITDLLNLTSMGGVTVTASSTYEWCSTYYPVSNLQDGSVDTYWMSVTGDTPNQGANTFVETIFTSPRKVAEVIIKGGYYYDFYGVTRARFEFFDEANNLLYSEEFDLSADAQIAVGLLENVKRFRLTALAANDGGGSYNQVSIAEIEILDDKSVTATASSMYDAYDPDWCKVENLFNPNESWYSAAGDHPDMGVNPWVEVNFTTLQKVSRVIIDQTWDYHYLGATRVKIELIDNQGNILFESQNDLTDYSTIDFPDVEGVKILKLMILETIDYGGCRGCGPNNELQGSCVNTCSPSSPTTCDDPSRTIFAGVPGTPACRQFDSDQASCEAAWQMSGAGYPVSCFYNKNIYYYNYVSIHNLDILTNVDGQFITLVQKPDQGVYSASSEWKTNCSGYYPSNLIDGNPETYWLTRENQTPSYGVFPYVDITFPSSQTVSVIKLNGGSWYYSYGITRARIELFDGNNTVLYSGEHDLGTISEISLPDIPNVKKAHFTALMCNYSYYCSWSEIGLYQKLENPEPIPGNINTCLGADTQVTIYIKDAYGNIVRTLTSNQPRTIGCYSDAWDLKDNSGFLVNDGIYYTVLEYDENGKAVTYDLSGTTGGSQFLPQRQQVSSNANVAKPFEDQFLPIKFTINKASEVTLFVGILWTSDTRIRTILNRVPLPAGEHTIYWDGLDDQGNIAEPPPGDSLILGLWGYTLPDNAIYVAGGKPIITKIEADPNYFSGFSEKCMDDGSGEGIILTYEVSEDVASVELRVYDVKTGYLIRTAYQNNISAGEHTFFWDGKNNSGEYADIGDYRVGLIAKDLQGNESMLKYTLVRFDH